MLDWSVVDDPSQADLEVISRGVIDYGRHLAIGGNAKTVACLVKDDDVLIAGGSGRTEFDRLFISFLWVAEGHRGQGLGTRILAELETYAASVGCADALIETLSDRAAALYERLGFRAVAKVPHYVGPYTKYVMVKPVSARR